jgi:hypothetical protein
MVENATIGSEFYGWSADARVKIEKRVLLFSSSLKEQKFDSH